MFQDSVSRGTETDFDQVCDTTAVNLNDSFGIWMGGKTSTPEKKGMNSKIYCAV